MNDHRFTPAEARARFGELRGMARVHREFETPEGLWRPVFDADVKLIGCQLYPGAEEGCAEGVLATEGRVVDHARTTSTTLPD